MHQIEEECATGRQNTTPKAKPLVPQTLISSVWQRRNFQGDALLFARATMLVIRKNAGYNLNFTWSLIDIKIRIIRLKVKGCQDVNRCCLEGPEAEFH
jgi:hypothetical protein